MPLSLMRTISYPLVERIRWIDALPAAQLNHNFTGNGINFDPRRNHPGGCNRAQRAGNVMLPKCCGTPAHFCLPGVRTRPPPPTLSWSVKSRKSWELIIDAECRDSKAGQKGRFLETRLSKAIARAGRAAGTKATTEAAKRTDAAGGPRPSPTKSRAPAAQTHSIGKTTVSNSSMHLHY